MIRIELTAEERTELERTFKGTPDRRLRDRCQAVLMADRGNTGKLLRMIKGIDPVYGKRLTQAFGEAVFDVIEQEPQRLREVTGIGPRRAERIVAGWANQKAIREIMLFLRSHGVGTSRAVRIFKTYGADAIQLISENPYRLARDIRGIGFKTADQIAQRPGIEPTAMIRARAGIGYALAEAMDEGHCGLPLDELISLAEALLEIPAATVEAALEL